MFLPPIAALFATFPFLGIAAYAAWKQLRTPGAANVAAILGKLRDMSWEHFSAVVVEALTRIGYVVTASQGGAVDYEARKDGRLALVSCKRWKVAQTGAGPLRELFDAKKAADAVKAQMIADKFDIFKGPLKDNKGAVVVAAGKSFKQTDIELEKMNYLGEGVLGSF